MAVIEKNIDKKLNAAGYSVTFLDDRTDGIYDPPYDKAVEFLIHNVNDFSGIKSFRLPKKKLVTAEYLIGKIANNTIYVNFAKDFEKLLNKLGLNSYSVYPTSYGIGVFRLYTHKIIVSNAKQVIDDILNDYGIKYTNEFSKAGWVYRYRISKSKENIKKMQNITL